MCDKITLSMKNINLFIPAYKPVFYEQGIEQ